MKTQPYLFNFTGMATAVALAAGTLGAGQVYAQSVPQFNVSDIQQIDLGKNAANTYPVWDTGSKYPQTPIAARPGGGAYIQWVSKDNFDTKENLSTAHVYATQVDNAGTTVGADIDLGQGRPGGIVATDTPAKPFAYYLVDADKLTFKVNGGSQTVVMDHEPKADWGNRRPVTFQPGKGPEFQNAPGHPIHTGNRPYGWTAPYLPITWGRGDLEYGNGRFGTVFSHADDQSNGTGGIEDSHIGGSSIFFDNSGSTPSLGYIWNASHSIDQRIKYDATNDKFYSVALGDYWPMDFKVTVHDNTGQRTSSVNILTTAANTGPIHGTDGIARANTAKQIPEDNSYFWGHSGAVAKMGDLHPLGDGTLALTYSLSPHKGIKWEGKTYTFTKNQLEYAVLNAQGQITRRQIAYQPDGKTGQGNYTEFRPYEKVLWVKSAKVGSGVLIFFRTETWDGTTLKYNFKMPPGATNPPKYVPSKVRMVQVDLQGNILQGPVDIPNTVGFNRGDGIEVLSNGSMAWTQVGNGSLKLNLWQSSGAGPGTTATLTLAQASVPVGSDIQANFASGPGNAADWIGIYRSGQTPAAGTPSTLWFYTNGTRTAGGSATTGSVTFTNPGLAAGTYDVYFLRNDGYEALGEPVTLTVTAANASPTLTLAQASVAVGSDIQVNFAGGPGNAADWIGIYRSGQTPAAGTPSTLWFYTNGTRTAGGTATTGSVTFTNPGLAAGTYDVYFLRDNGYTQLAGPITLTVTGSL